MTPGLLNFVVVGELRSGAAAVQSALANHSGITCYGGLFHRDEAVRRHAHEINFGPCEDPDKSPEWFVDHLASPWQYLNHYVFDRPRGKERAVGCSVSYDFVKRFELWDLIAHRCREGDFCLIHVVRNPAACFISLKQAERSNYWCRGPRAKPSPPPMAVSIDAVELTTFCRDHLACRAKLDVASDDTLVMPYDSVLGNFQAAMRKAFDFLEQPNSPEPARTDYLRLRNRSMAERITNMPALRAAVPSDVRALLDAEDFC